MNEEETERGLLPRTPETSSSKEEGRSSTGKGTAPVTPQSLSPKDDRKITSRYLGNSVSSCHDFCKFGRKHSFRSKERHYSFPLSTSSRITPQKEPVRVKIPSLAERRKKPSAKKTGLHDKHVILEENSLSTPKVKKTTKPKNIDKGTAFPEKHELSNGNEISQCASSSASERIEASGEFGSIESSKHLEGSIGSDDARIPQGLSFPREKTKVSRNAGTVRTSNGKKLLRNAVSSPQSVSAEKMNKSSKDQFSSIKSKIMQKVPSPLKEAISSAKSKVGKQVAPSPPKRTDASARLSASERLKGTNMKPASKLISTEGTTNRNYGNKKVKSTDPPMQIEKKTVKPPSTSLSSRPTLNRIPSITLRKVKVTRSASLRRPKVVEKTVTEKIIEKALHIIAPRSAAGRTQQSRASSSSVSNREQKHRDPVAASASKFVRAKVKKPVQSEDKRTTRKGATNNAEAKDVTAQKLKFSRGKVVEPHVVSEAPRKLIFRQARKLGSSQSGKFGRRSFKNRDSSRGDIHHPCPEAQAVVLKHQDVPDKKETPVLYNDVIEETASKLVGTRKSKVKALVSAFETVISLQERRPVPQF